MENLIEQLHHLFGNYFVFYSKIHQFHWNIRGNNFPQYHNFFGDLYKDIWQEIDVIAEKIRQEDYLVSANFVEISQWAQIKNCAVDLCLNEMLRDLIEDDLIIQQNLNNCFSSANQTNNQGLVNYFTSRLEYHQKLNWQLRSCL
jgi:starvation-inducible DNA-binding protein